MEGNYLESPGKIVNRDDLILSEAIGVANAIEKLPFFSLLEVRKIDDASKAEVVVFDVEIERCQHPVNDIRRVERLAIIFKEADDRPPEVLALREDFPQVPHLNIRKEEKPRSLCLFEETHEEVKLRWNPMLFLERIRQWLSHTARGELHQEDQPLEPLLIGPMPNLIYPFDLFDEDSGKDDRLLFIRPIVYKENRLTFLAQRSDIETQSENGKTYLATAIQGKPQEHGIIHKEPNNLLELHHFLENAGIDLLAILRETLKNNILEQKKYADANLIIITYLPKSRVSNGTVESSDVWAFLIPKAIKDIGISVGIWQIHDGEIGSLILPNTEKKGEDLEVYLLNPIPSFSRERANLVSGLSEVEKKEIVLIGAGALGSQILLNLVRMGIGKWSIIDDDCLLPHNLGRHALPGYALGHTKAVAVAHLTANILDEDEVAKAIVADVLRPEKDFDKLKTCYSAAEIIIDASTSVPVARHIARDIESEGRRISIFLNPSGDSLVLLAEDKERRIKLDCLEMQYYRVLINEHEHENHLKMESGSVRYGRSCRDLSNRIPQHLVAMHSAIGSKAILDVISSDAANIAIWKVNRDDLTTKHFEYKVFEIIEIQNEEWSLCVDSHAYEKILAAREKKLPKETGGILIGTFDMLRKIIYVAETVLSPTDSVEWPTVYIRGHKGLAERVNKIREKTQGLLQYVGEWHSHPQGCKTWPSNDDIKAFHWLTDIMEVEGLPGVMMIAGDNRTSWFIGCMDKSKD